MTIFVWNKFSSSHKVFIDATFQMLRILLSSPTFLCSWFFLPLPGKKKKSTTRLFICVYFKLFAELFKWLIFLFPLHGVLFLWDLIRVFYKNMTISRFCSGIRDLCLYLASAYKAQQVLPKPTVLVLWGPKWKKNEILIKIKYPIIPN